jgi:hypothetical protein
MGISQIDVGVYRVAKRWGNLMDVADATLVRSREAQRIISDAVGVSCFVSYTALRCWEVPVQKRRNLCLYRRESINSVIKRFESGEWPNRSDIWGNS